MTEIPTYSECVIGFRQWRVDDWVLCPSLVGAPWHPGANRARCQKSYASGGLMFWTKAVTNGTDPAPEPPADHTAPHKDCVCGLYALHEPPAERFRGDYVIGAVAAWGDVQVHHDGFRAEYAQIIALAQQDDLPGNVDLTQIARFYGVPLVPLDMLVLEAGRHGLPLPESIRPEKPAPPVLGQSLWMPGSWHYGGSPFTFGQASVTFTWEDTGVVEEAPPIPKKKSNRQGPPRKKRPPKNQRPPKGY